MYKKIQTEVPRNWCRITRWGSALCPSVKASTRRLTSTDYPVRVWHFTCIQDIAVFEWDLLRTGVPKLRYMYP